METRGAVLPAARVSLRRRRCCAHHLARAPAAALRHPRGGDDAAAAAAAAAAGDGGVGGCAGAPPPCRRRAALALLASLLPAVRACRADDTLPPPPLPAPPPPDQPAPAPPPPAALPAGSSTRQLSPEERTLLEQNQRIRSLNRAPDDFPAFIRKGYEVTVLADGYVYQDNGLVYKDYATGDGELPEDGQQVTFHYVAYNEAGGLVDSTYRRGRPAETRLGIGGLIPGFEAGLKSMKVGGRRRVIVPPELGPPTGPATFFSAKQFEVFDVELLGIKSCSRTTTGGFLSTVTCA